LCRDHKTKTHGLPHRDKKRVDEYNEKYTTEYNLEEKVNYDYINEDINEDNEYFLRINKELGYEFKN